MNLLLRRKPTKKSIQLEVNKKYLLLKMTVLDTKYGPNIKIETPVFFCFMPNRYYQYLKEAGVKKIQDELDQGRPIYILSMGAVSKTVSTEYQQINEKQFLSIISDADNINHVVVFLTGAVPFPEGTAGQVFFSWPDYNAPPNWQLLGYISNNKPSAIFRISTLKKLDEMGDSDFVNTFGQQAICHNAQIGISIEPLEITQYSSQSTNSDSYISFAQKMLQNFMNYILSYSINQSQMVADHRATYVPLTTVQNWYTNFERRLSQNPNFWKT